MRCACVACALVACGPTAPSSGDARGIDGAITIDSTPVSLTDAAPCNQLHATIRDFHKTHPDFEHFTSDAVVKGLVAPSLGGDHTPSYAPAGATVCTSGPTQFADWYHDVAGANVAIPITLSLIETSPGTYVFDSGAFFPIDGQGFGDEGFDHNFSFTTEIHTLFTYQGGESFTFRGDDDLWMFVNGQLAIDLGGTHQPATTTVNVDDLGLTKGG
ncbi:MAG TPA: fibro-slime domain-containing protein, partial [Kofleriaceae bacterium]|nr:fibro-slime domain-containing protein [Kofleriaceae bacterium]